MLFTRYTEIYTAEWEADGNTNRRQNLLRCINSKSCNIGSEAKCSQNNQLPPRLMFTVQQGFNEAAMKL